MRPGALIPVLAVGSAWLVGGPAPGTSLAGPAVPPSGQVEWGLHTYDLTRSAAVQVNLPGRLREASGLAVSPDGRVFTHDDERGRVYEVDPASGEVMKRIDVGSGGITGDFEGIAIAGPWFYLVESDGTLYRFVEGEDREGVDYRRVDTGVGRRCEVEGLAYDEQTESLLMVCKTTRGRDLRDHLVVFAAPLGTLVADPEPRIKVPFRSLRDVDARGRLHPSGLEVHPESRTFFVVAAREEGLVEVSREGRFLAAAELPHSMHRQPEGITFLGPDLLLADEASGKRPTLTRYPHRPPPDPDSDAAGGGR